jgi:hypothetical protein
MCVTQHSRLIATAAPLEVVLLSHLVRRSDAIKPQIAVFREQLQIA